MVDAAGAWAGVSAGSPRVLCAGGTLMGWLEFKPVQTAVFQCAPCKEHHGGMTGAKTGMNQGP